MSPRSRFVKGVGFASVTASLWGMLPILMDAALHEFKSGTVVWFRFTFAFLVLFAILWARSVKPWIILRKPPVIGLLSAVCLAANYFLFMEGIRLSSPSNSAVVIQSAPVMLVLIGVYYFNETINRLQVTGLILAGIGFSFFFNEQAGSLSGNEFYFKANMVITLAALTWAVYMALQKKLQDRYSSQELNLLVYGTAALVLVGLVDWNDFNSVSNTGGVLMVVLGINTLLAYGCLTEAIKYIPLSLISVIVALNPFITMFLMQMAPVLFPEWIRPESISMLGYLGAVTAIGGVIVVIRFHQQPKLEETPSTT
ncbi:MAG: DMT family transporter [Candidatus Nitronauta litoralis]|uniref:DMT family transporter n=1 Tax=Candidatus Nitronauta litoralis TaxID=2705533 RepID=A0A7T0BT83_9BACT|nr:MAG: DMT family transporter [Candidatus Nitronauta litoralis]